MWRHNCRRARPGDSVIATKFVPLPRYGERHPRWKGGRYTTSDGYVYVRVGVGKYKREHRLVMEDFLNRPLLPDEIVHHRNSRKKDNRPENLKLFDQSRHTKFHWRQRRGCFSPLQGNLFDLKAEQQSLF